MALPNSDYTREQLIGQIPKDVDSSFNPTGRQIGSSWTDSELGRNVANTLSSLPGVGGFASRAGGVAARTAGRGLSTDRVIPAAWELVEEGGALAKAGGNAAQTLGQIGQSTGAALARASTAGPEVAALPNASGAAQLLGAPAQAGPLVQAAQAGARVMPQAAQGAETAALGAPAASQTAQALGGTSSLLKVGAAGAGAAALLGGSANVSTGAGAGRGQINPPLADPSGPLPTSSVPALPSASGAVPSAETQKAPEAAAALNNITRVGNSYSGGNIGGDFTINGASPRNGGFISAQNMQAADNLAASQDASARARLMGTGPVEPGGFTGGFTGVIGPQSGNGNMWSRSPEQRLRDAEVSASSIMNRPSWGARDAARTPAMMGYAAALQGEQDTAKNHAAFALENLRQSGSMQRTGLEQQGANARAILGDLGADRRVGVEQSGALQRTNLQEAGHLERQKIASQATVDAANARTQAPTGYRYTSDGSLTHIPGGPADPTVRGSRAPLNDTQAKALQFGTRMQEAGKTFDELADKGVNRPGDLKRAADAVGMGAVANWTQSSKEQRAEQAQRDFVNALLRRESGAAISDSEFANARQQYFPQIGDKPDVIEQKRRNREIATSGLMAEVPDAEKRVSQVLGAAQKPVTTESTTQVASRPAGTVSTVNGKTAIWNGSKWVPQ